ncbi:HU family DNA-binding protein [Candidatus Neomarinimicrobiota bacterium]
MEDKLTYQELIDRLAQDTGESKAALQSFLPQMVGVIREGLERDKKSRVSKFGIFELHEIPETTGTNPRTGDPIKIAAHQRVAFKPNDVIEESVNREYADLKSRPVPRVSESPTVPPPPPKSEPAGQTAADIPEQKRRFGLVDAIALIAVLIAVFVMVQRLGILEIPTGDDTFMQYVYDLVQEDETAAVDTLGEDVYPYETDTEDDQESTDEGIAPSIDMSTREEIKTVKAESDKKPDKEPAPTPPIAPANKLEPAGQPMTNEPLAYGDRHIVTNDERLWDLAEQYYGEPLFWVNIYRVNRERLLDPDGLAKGMQITIPALRGTAKHLAPEDSINIANGAYQAHRAYKRAGSKHSDYYLRMSNKYR